MRWLFADPANQDEAAAVRVKVAAIDHWWGEFQANQSKLENYLKRTTRWDFAAFMDEALLAVDSRLMYEFGTALEQSVNRLVITPQSARWLRPLVRTMLERAPKVAGWEFYAYRPAEAAATAIETVKTRAEADISGAVVSPSIAPGRKVDLTFHFPGLELDEETGSQIAFTATEALLGEQVLDTWIGSIEVSQSGPENALHVANAQIAVATLIRGLVERIPAERTPDIGAAAELPDVQLDPPEAAEDYSGRDDIVTASMSSVELLEAIYSGQSFTSACHSKVGESFCHLKLDVMELPEVERAAWTTQLASELNSALLAANAGCCFGTARGVRYAYVDLAITNLKQAVVVVRKVLAEQRAPLRSWLLFHDDDLAAEWIGIYRETPPPPMAMDEE
jgi:hypothetical protein